MKSTILSVKHSDTIPKEFCLDNTIRLLLEGYLYIPNRTRKYESDLYQTRLLGQKVVCMSGEKAAQKFYDQTLFTRKGAVPKRIQETLFGKKGIQTLVGAAHMDRKQMFMSMMTPPRIDAIKKLTRDTWNQYSSRFQAMDNVVLFEEASKLFFEIACKWAGVPIYETEVRKRANDMSAMIDGFGGVGPRHVKGRIARNCSEKWATDIIKRVRLGRVIAPTNTALSSIAWHKDPDGSLLEPKIAGIELLNILRPITAIATYVTFSALALHMYPECKKRLAKQKDDRYLTMFAQEVRRFYPFGPFLGARVRRNFKWRDHLFKQGDLVLLDIYGTNHNPKLWQDPNVFRPERFAKRQDNPFDFIPQGGGSYDTGTRCPGEWITLELMKTSINHLVNRIEYEVPLQNLSYSLRRMPTLPKSKFILTKVRKKALIPNEP